VSSNISETSRITKCVFPPKHQPSNSAVSTDATSIAYLILLKHLSKLE